MLERQTLACSWNLIISSIYLSKDKGKYSQAMKQILKEATESKVSYEQLKSVVYSYLVPKVPGFNIVLKAPKAPQVRRFVLRL